MSFSLTYPPFFVNCLMNTNRRITYSVQSHTRIKRGDFLVAINRWTCSRSIWRNIYAASAAGTIHHHAKKTTCLSPTHPQNNGISCSLGSYHLVKQVHDVDGNEHLSGHPSNNSEYFQDSYLMPSIMTTSTLSQYYYSCMMSHHSRMDQFQHACYHCFKLGKN